MHDTQRKRAATSSAGPERRMEGARSAPRPAESNPLWSRLATRAGPLQAKLTVNTPGDAHEREADRVADQVLRMPEPEGRQKAPSVQRMCVGCEEEEAKVQRMLPEESDDEEQQLQAKEAAGATPAVSRRTEAWIAAMRGGGRPLSDPVRSYFEPRFGRDLSMVRLHTGADATAAAHDVHARAFTVGSDIAFAPGELQPESSEGKRLLAHELTHTVQQRAAPEPSVARQDEGGGGTGTAPAPTSPWKSGSQCGRNNRENTDFPNTRIERIDIDLGNLTTGMTLTWLNPAGLTLPTGGFPISPGAGRCCRDCDDPATSTTSGSLCTPKGNWRMQRKGCVLSTASWAINPTYFSRAGIAIHAGPLPGYPASHGCVRTTEEASAIIHDNTAYSRRFAADESRGLTDRRTEVVVTGTWVGSKCYRGESLKDRATACPAASGGAAAGALGGAAVGVDETTPVAPVETTPTREPEEDGP